MSQLKVNSIVDAAGGSSAVLYGVASPPNSMGFRNRLINSDMRIDQRNAGASVTVPTLTNTYCVDRFFGFATQASKFSLQQNAGSVTPPSGFINYLGATSSSAYSISASDVFVFGQKIEGLNVADLGWGTVNASTVTLSFWVRSSLTGTFGGSIRNSAGNRTYPFSYTITSANTWEQKSITIAGDTTGTWLSTNGIGVTVFWSIGSGSTYSTTAGTWAAGDYYSATGATSVVGTNGATFYITGVQLEAGSVASPFERRDYGRELMMCQRYYQKSQSFFAITSPSNQTSVLGSYSQFAPMRANPTVTVPSGSIAFHRPGVAFYAVTAVVGGQNANGGGYSELTIATGAGTLTSGQINDGLVLSAEL